MTRLRTCLVWTVLMVAVVLVPERLYAQATAGIPEKILAYPEMIVFNGKIATMDEKTSTVQAMAVRNGRILARGTNAEVQKLAGPRTQMMDAKGRTVLPGLVDIHTHPHLWLMDHFGQDGAYNQKFIVDPQLKLTPVDGSTSAEIKKAIDTAIRKRVAELGPGKWILIKLNPNLAPPPTVLDKGWLTTEDLDNAAPNNPVFAAVGIFSSIINSKAKEIVKAKFASNTRMVKELPTQSLWYFIVYDEILRGKTSAVKDILTMELLEYAAQGITTVGTNVESVELLRVLNQMDRKGEMPVRWGTIHRSGYFHANDPAEFYRLFGDFAGQGSEYLWSLGVGAEDWDFGSNTRNCTKAVPKEIAARSLPCAAYGPGTGPYDAYLASIKAGLRLGSVHGGSRDGTLDNLFGMIETAMREGPLTLDQIREQRIYIDHGNMIRPDQIPLLKKYNISMTVQSHGLANGGRDMEERYGPEYLKWVMPTKSMLDGGVRLAVSSDIPMVQPQWLMSPANYGIWLIIEYFITREFDGRVWVPEERLDRVSTLRGITTDAAWLFFREKDLGSLEEGKLADFTILDKDYFTIPEKEIHTIKNLLTVIGGKIVHRSPEF